MDIKKIKQLREKTGAGIADCNKALAECGNDLKKAEVWLKQKGIQKAEKKKDRVTAQGVIDAYIHGKGKIGVLVEVLCETDFVARTHDFKLLAHELALQISAMNPKDTKELLGQPYIRDPKQTVSDMIKSMVAKLGENLTVGRFERMELGE